MTYDPRYYATLSGLRDAIDVATRHCGATDTRDALQYAIAEIDVSTLRDTLRDTPSDHIIRDPFHIIRAGIADLRHCATDGPDTINRILDRIVNELTYGRAISPDTDTDTATG